MTPKDLRARFADVAVWRRGSKRAPHKPLMLLLALGRFASGEEATPFSSAEAPLRDLLDDFGPSRARHHPEYPFWRLQNDGIWILDEADGLERRASNSDPTVTSLRAMDPAGRFPDEIADLLRQRPALIGDLARDLLDAHFPSSLHDAVLSAVGVDPDALGASGERRQRRPRDRAFRDAVLRAYGYRCAVCGFETRVGRALVGVDAAHVKWHQAGGEDAVSNGLALCALHHRLLDRGAFTLAPVSPREVVVDVSEEAHGGEGFKQWLLDFHGRPLAHPIRRGDRIAEPSAAWHRREVFKGRARE
jgi:putative restriction endonuclease